MPTLVLVPGAWLGGWVWKKVLPSLDERGCECYPVTLTGMGERVHLASKNIGIETAIQDVVNVMEYNDLGDVVLVGHSFAGKVVAAAADRAGDRVKMILYLDAFRPEKVRTPQGGFGDEWNVKGWTVPLTNDILKSIGKDVRGADLRWLRSKATPWPLKYASDTITLSKRFDSIRSAYVFCTGGGDDIDLIMKEKLDGPSTVIESGHWPMITKPKETVADILRLIG